MQQYGILFPAGEALRLQGLPVVRPCGFVGQPIRQVKRKLQHGSWIPKLAAQMSRASCHPSSAVYRYGHPIPDERIAPSLPTYTAAGFTRIAGGGRPQDATGRIGSDYLRKAREEMERRLQVKRVDADPLPRIVWDEAGQTVAPGRAATLTPGQRASMGMRNPPSHVVPFSPWKGIIPPSGHAAISEGVLETLQRHCRQFPR